jgi:hypothetical protein
MGTSMIRAVDLADRTFTADSCRDACCGHAAVVDVWASPTSPSWPTCHDTGYCACACVLVA